MDGQKSCKKNLELFPQLQEQCSWRAYTFHIKLRKRWFGFSIFNLQRHGKYLAFISGHFRECLLFVSLLVFFVYLFVFLLVFSCCVSSNWQKDPTIGYWWMVFISCHIHCSCCSMKRIFCFHLFVCQVHLFVEWCSTGATFMSAVVQLRQWSKGATTSTTSAPLLFLSFCILHRQINNKRRSQQQLIFFLLTSKYPRNKQVSKMCQLNVLR